jgi:CheY-like chemotaxis protein
MPRVLFVEDDDDVRENLAVELGQAGLEVLEERLAEAALHSLERYAPDLLLLDIVMPPREMSGLEMLARLRESARWRSLPVIVLSGLGDHLNIDTMARLDVRAVLTKTEVTGTDVARWIEAALP